MTPLPSRKHPMQIDPHVRFTPLVLTRLGGVGIGNQECPARKGSREQLRQTLDRFEYPPHEERLAA